jgi:hypothetical protein
MSQPLSVTLRNDTGHRHVFTVVDLVCQATIVNGRDLDSDETVGVQLCRDDNDQGSIQYSMNDQIGGTRQGINDGDTVNMD